MRTTTKCLTVLGVAVAAGAAGHQYYGEAMIDELVSRKASTSSTAAMPATSPLYREFRKRQAERAEQPAPVSPSPWIAAEKRRYLAVLERTPADVLVLPFQMPADGKALGIDASARTTMAYVTSQLLAAGGVHVADVSYVARALGEPRRLGPDEAAEFGRTVGARTIVAGHVWHDGAGHLSVRLSTFPSSAAPSSGRTAAREGIAISDASTPELAYSAIAGEMLAEIGMGKSRMRSAVRPAARRPLGTSPLASIADVRTEVSEGIWLQHLMGVLHPADPARMRAAVFERSLAALESVAPASQDYRVLKARALAHLDRRPAAVALLRRNPNSAEERALLAYLDGNVPQLARAAAEIKRPIPRLVAELELVSLRYEYAMTLEELAREAERIAKTVPTEWAPLVIWNVSGLSNWNVRDTMEVKLVLDAHFPLPGFTADSAMQAKSVAGARGDGAWAERQGLALEHRNRVVAASGGEWSKPAALWMPRPQQYLDLLAAHAHAMLLRRIEFVCCVQGRRDEGLRLLDVISETVYLHGSAALHLRKAGLLNERMQRTAGREQKLALAQQIYDSSNRALQWNTTDPSMAAEASRLELISGRFRSMNPARPNTARYRDLNDMKSDYPPTLASLRWRDTLISNGHGSREVRVERACAYSKVAPAPCDAWRRDAEAAGDENLARRIEKEELVARFNGSPRRLALLVDAARSRGDVTAAAAYARESIRTHPATWAGYDALGSVYRAAGDYKAAAEAYARYPRFRENGGNTVDISNTAHRVAREFARRGAMNEARTYYEIAARHRNGSDAALASAFALAVMERRFGDARAIAEDRVSRYPSDESAEVYISLLFALPETESAWSAAREAIIRYERSGPWRAAAVGLRAKQTDVDGVMQWSKEFVRAPEYASSPWLDPKAMKALRAATQLLAMDRQPAAIAALPALSAQLFPPQPLPQRPAPDTPEKKAAAEALDALLKPPAFGEQREGYAGNAKLYLERFTAGYLQFKRGDYGAAWDAYGHWAHPSNESETAESLYAALPYYAYSAMKAGKRAELIAYLERYSKPGKRDKLGNIEPAFPAFDLDLARAIVAAHEGQHDLTRKHLALARASMARPGLRPLPPAYVYAEICEHLAADGVPGLRERIVEWARAHQLHRPWDAWPYAFEARHSGVEADRVRALAIALQLDPRSARAGELDEPLRRKAQQWLAINQAFPKGALPQTPPPSRRL